MSWGEHQIFTNAFREVFLKDEPLYRSSMRMSPESFSFKLRTISSWGVNGRLDTSYHVLVSSIQIPSFNMPLCLVGNKPFIFMTQYIRYSSDPDKCDTLQSHAPMIKTKVTANRLKREIKAQKQMNRWITMHRRASRYEECVKALFRQFSWAKGGWQIRKASHYKERSSWRGSFTVLPTSLWMI